MTSTTPDVSIVIPVHNEEPLLHAAVIDLLDRLEDCSYTWELILAENGSVDNTTVIAQALAQKYANISVLSLPEPNYGSALRQGIIKARGTFVICEEIDLCDTAFHEQALNLLRNPNIDIVVGSKLLKGASDERPMMRHAASYIYSALLKVTLGFRGTDTHGLKALRRSTVVPIVNACIVDRDVFASELIIRAERANLNVIEIPIRVMELRPPSINLLSRIPRVVSNVIRLALALR
jgi:glycosyltransferase involved in cell wall biosynthesis